MKLQRHTVQDITVTSLFFYSESGTGVPRLDEYFLVVLLVPWTPPVDLSSYPTSSWVSFPKFELEVSSPFLKISFVLDWILYFLLNLWTTLLPTPFTLRKVYLSTSPSPANILSYRKRTFVYDNLYRLRRSLFPPVSFFYSGRVPQNIRYHFSEVY